MSAQVFDLARRRFIVRSGVIGLSTWASSSARAESAWPAWRRGMRPWTWKAISLNTLSDINPERNPKLNPHYPNEAPWHGVMGHRAVMDKWSGGAWDEHSRFLWVHGGGHTDSAENSVYGIDLASDAPRWQLLRPPTGAIGNQGLLDDRKENSGMYFDGRPRSSHTYGLLNVVDRDLVMWPTGAQFITGGGTAMGWRFSRSTQDWSQIANTPLDYAEHYSGTCWVAPTRELWHFPNTNSAAWVLNIDTRQARRVEYEAKSSACKAPVYDPVRGYILVFGNMPQGFVLVRPEGAHGPAWTPPVKGEVPAAYSSEGRGADGWAYDALNDRFCSRRGKTADLNILIPPRGANPAWEWRIQNATADTPLPPPPNSTGTYGRWFASEALGIVGCVNRVEEKLYVMAVTA